MLLDFLLALQSLVHPLTGVDIVEHTTGYTWALQGLCQQSDVKQIENKLSACFRDYRNDMDH